jgi:WhiB family redox-sensing transcriptional regulator
MLTSCPPGELSLDALPKEFRDELPCRMQDADLWFAEAPADLERAKAFCQGCPVRTACLIAALERGEPWGVWGGEIFDAGVVIARKRPRGRPRKNETREVAA